MRNNLNTTIACLTCLIQTYFFFKNQIYYFHTTTFSKIRFQLDSPTSIAPPVKIIFFSPGNGGHGNIFGNKLSFMLQIYTNKYYPSLVILSNKILKFIIPQVFFLRKTFIKKTTLCLIQSTVAENKFFHIAVLKDML